MVVMLFFTPPSLQMSAHIMELGATERLAKDIFQFLFLKSREIMEADGAAAGQDKQSVSMREMSIAIRMYGYMAAPCRLLLSESDLKMMFKDIAQRSEQQIFSSSEDDEVGWCSVLFGGKVAFCIVRDPPPTKPQAEDNAVMHLPSYIDAISSMISEISEVCFR